MVSWTKPAISSDRQPSGVGLGTTENVDTAPSSNEVRLSNEACPY